MATKKKSPTQFDAIVVGSGITGGWAAKELTERGLHVLVLERGRDVKPMAGTGGYTTEHFMPYQFKFRGMGDKRKWALERPVQRLTGQIDEANEHFWIKDTENPYTTPKDRPFTWFRGHHLGGRSIMWGRQSYRFAPINFEDNAKDGHGCDWPIRYDDLAPWYSHVERFIGVAAEHLDCPTSPDGEFQPPLPMNVVEQKYRDAVQKRFPDRRVSMARVANLTQPVGDRLPCHFCQWCSRGCTTGSYFSSLSSTLPAARATGRLTVRTDSIAHSVIYDAKKNRATGVRVIDARTHATREYRAKLVVLCASAFESVRLLLNSAIPEFSTGLANSSGVLGKFIMDHYPSHLVLGETDGPAMPYYSGGRPAPLFSPRFRNVTEQRQDYVRGFMVNAGAYPIGWERGTRMPGVGAEFKQALRKRDRWQIFSLAMIETLPSETNRISLDPSVKDKWGIPAVHIDFQFGANEAAMRPDASECVREMVEAAGFENIMSIPIPAVPGEAIHEMGGARMGRDPKTSVLNAWNQTHDVPNLLVTDGAAMASASNYNPSLTYMALTARACAHAVEALKRREI